MLDWTRALRREPLLRRHRLLRRFWRHPRATPIDRARGLQYLGSDRRRARRRLCLALRIAGHQYSGCAPHPGWIMETLLALSLGVFDRADMDSLGGRVFSRIISRITDAGATSFTNSRRARALLRTRMPDGESRLQATQAVGDCNQRSWKAAAPDQAGSTCIACTSPVSKLRAAFSRRRNSRAFDRAAARYAKACSSLSPRCRNRRRQDACVRIPVRIASNCRRFPREEAKMSRIVIGPFNRVEGDLEVTLDVDAGTVRQAYVSAPLYRALSKSSSAAGRGCAGDRPRICGICSVSQSLAVAAVLRAAGNARARQRPALDQHRHAAETSPTI